MTGHRRAALIVAVLCATATHAEAGGWIEDPLVDAAMSVHRDAIAKRKAWDSGGRVDDALHRDALAAYARACRMYEQFLAAYPSSDLAYEIQYQLGEVLYFSGHFRESVPHYRWVRDHRDPRAAVDRTVEAARSVLNAYENVCPVTTRSLDEIVALPRPLAPLALPRCQAQLMVAYIEYARLLPDDAVAPGMALNAALVALTYMYLDEAVTRLDEVVARFPASPQARSARDALVIVERLRAETVTAASR